jgi:hypothetical protein
LPRPKRRGKILFKALMFFTRRLYSGII